MQTLVDNGIDIGAVQQISHDCQVGDLVVEEIRFGQVGVAGGDRRQLRGVRHDMQVIGEPRGGARTCPQLHVVSPGAQSPGQDRGEAFLSAGVGLGHRVA